MENDGNGIRCTQPDSNFTPTPTTRTPRRRPSSSQRQTNSAKKTRRTPPRSSQRSTPRRSISSSAGAVSRQAHSGQPESSLTSLNESLPQPRNDMIFFAMPKQRVKAYWQFIDLVADERYVNVPNDQLNIGHAKYAWCHRCKMKVEATKGRNDAGPHMNRFHVEAVASFRQHEERRRTQNTARSLINIYESSHSDEEFDDPANEAEQRRTVDLLVQWIATSLRPLNIVADPGFAALLRYVNSVSGRLSIPSRQTAKARIQVKASQLRSSLRIRLSADAECYFFSVTSDIWSSLCAESYISFTLHYVDENFYMHKWTLEVTSIPGKHDGPAIAAALLKCFDTWSLDKTNCVRFLRDGASNITRACSQIGVASMSCVAHSLHLVVGAALIRKPQDLELTTSVDDVRPYRIDRGALNIEASIQAEFDIAASSDDGDCDSVNSEEMSNSELPVEMRVVSGLDVTDSDMDEPIDPAEVSAICEQVAGFVQDCAMAPEDLESVRQTVRRFRKLAEYFHRSPKGTSRLDVLQGGASKARKVKIDSPTRWNSTMDMLQRLIQLRPVLNAFFSYLCSPEGSAEFGDVSETLNSPTAEEWFVVECLVKLLEPFRAVTEYLSGDNYPTMVRVHASIRTLKLLLSDPNIFEDMYTYVKREPYAKRVVAKMKSVRRSFVTLLFKRFENRDSDLIWISLLDPFFTNSTLLTDEETMQAKTRLKEEMAQVARDLHTNEMHRQNSSRTTTTATGMASFKRLIYKDRWATRDFDEQTLDQELEWELQNYILTSSAAQVNEKEHPSSLEWWREYGKTFPRIAPLARKWLGCVATSVSSERAFSTAGNTVTKRRSSLSPETVRDLVFIKENTKDKST